MNTIVRRYRAVSNNDIIYDANYGMTHYFDLLWICRTACCTACCTTNPQRIEASGVRHFVNVNVPWRTDGKSVACCWCCGLTDDWRWRWSGEQW